ncbi:MAG: response regulator [Verrucomicrobiae bacterium]|nr:response regulator [Verrucomicrobiae bacterium]
MALEHDKLILIIEDELDLARWIEFYLQRRGYDTLAAHDGTAGYDAAFRRWPDLVILDLMLPKMHGLEVCRLLKSNPHTAHVPVLVLTALDAESYREQCLAAGAEDFLTKPFDPQQLLARVDAVFEEREALCGVKR